MAPELVAGGGYGGLIREKPHCARREGWGESQRLPAMTQTKYSIGLELCLSTRHWLSSRDVTKVSPPAQALGPGWTMPAQRSAGQ